MRLLLDNIGEDAGVDLSLFLLKLLEVGLAGGLPDSEQFLRLAEVVKDLALHFNGDSISVRGLFFLGGVF